MRHHRPARLAHIAPIGVDRMGELADARSSTAVASSAALNCILFASGLSDILNVLLATVVLGDEAIVTDSTYVWPHQPHSSRWWRVRIRAVPVSPEFDLEARLRCPPRRRQHKSQCSRHAADVSLHGTVDADDWSLIAELCVEHDLSSSSTPPWNGCSSMVERTRTVGGGLSALQHSQQALSLRPYIDELQSRRDLLMRELEALPVWLASRRLVDAPARV
ncbi:aspartate aminotransferase B [Arthroderma uncinatum]|uniref:aspartate aminotransferase B n=1 Tax=Arthroderma uncinatum TaxID=74035 RepID=UPI00144A7485|nr:aspartate aminotransferase B [Arthroderma uncinatum]KAF3482609.1 aspartate aminotransferase B [Arthroderma uncinatum]